jgi:hypothetical protein
MRTRPNLTLVALLTATTSGCSFLSVYGPAPTAKPVINVSCTEERYAPALDVAIMGSGLLEAATGDISTDARLGAVVGALIYGGSAIYGYLTTSECEKAKDAAHRYQTKLLIRQIDLLNESASQNEPSSAPSVPLPPAASPEEDPTRPPPPEQVPPSPVQ